MTRMLHIPNIQNGQEILTLANLYDYILRIKNLFLEFFLVLISVHKCHQKCFFLLNFFS